MRASNWPKAFTVSESAFSLSSRLVASPWTAFTLEPRASNSSVFSGEISSTLTFAPSPTRPSTTARPIPEPPPVTRATLSLSPATLVSSPGSVRLFEELRERRGGLPGQALQQGGVQVGLIVQLGREDLQPRIVPDANLANECVRELVRELGVLFFAAHPPLFDFFRVCVLGWVLQSVRERLGGLPRQALYKERVEVDSSVRLGRVDLQPHPVPGADLAHEDDRVFVADLGVLVFHVPLFGRQKFRERWRGCASSGWSGPGGSPAFSASTARPPCATRLCAPRRSGLVADRCPAK